MVFSVVNLSGYVLQYFRLFEACRFIVSPLNYSSWEINHMTLKMKTKSHFSMGNRTLIHVDLLAMNVSWTPKDLELVENEFDFLVSMVCTIVRFITFVMAIVVHRAFYRLMKRLPGRAVNQVIYPYMVLVKA